MSAGFHLLIDTTVDGATIGIASAASGEVLAYENRDSKQQNSSSLNTLAHNVAKDVGVDLDTVSKIVVANGPGSFTGIKVGLAFAYGLQHLPGNRRQVSGYSPLQQLCEADSSGRTWVLGATRDRGAMAFRDENGSVALSDLNLKTSGKWPVNGVVLVKSWPLLEEQLAAVSIPVEKVELAQFHKLSMAAAALAGQIEDDTIGLPEPVYLRKSTAEEKLDGK